MSRLALFGPGVVAALLLGLSCARSSAPPVATSTPALPAPTPSSPVAPRLQTYRLSAKAMANQSLSPRSDEEDGGILVQGMRIALRPSGTSLAQDVAEPMLLGGERISSAWGGGFLFWNNTAVFSARTFLAELRPIVSTRGRVASVSFGPSFALVRQHDGDRWAWNPEAGGRIKIAPVGLVDIASSPDGRVAAVLEGGRLLTSVDSGKTYKDSTAQAQPWPGVLAVDSEGVWISLGSGTALRLEKDGSLAEFPSIPKKREQSKDERWTLPESPLERAYSRGIPLDERTAVVEAAGAMAKIDLGTGAILDITRRVLPPNLNCESLRLGAQIVTACQATQGNRTSLVASSPLFGEPFIEKTFQTEGRFSSGGANVLYEGPCEGTEKRPGALCLRRGGSWIDLDASQNFNDTDAGPAGASQPKYDIARWIPGEDTGAIGIVTRPSLGFLHARSGAFVECGKDCKMRSVDGILNRVREDVIDRTWVMTRDGSLRGWTRDGAVTVTLEGTVIPSPFHWNAVSSVGNLGLAWQTDGTVWQSEDRGETWKEVLAPPWRDNSRIPMMCSEVGCQLGPWLRLGWNQEPPAPRPKPQVVRTPAFARTTPVPTLSCVGSGEAQISTRNPEENPTVQNELGFGARLFQRAQRDTMFFRANYGLTPLHPIISVDSSGYGMAAMMAAKVPDILDSPTGPAPAKPSELENTYTWWYAEPFDVSMTVRTTTMRLRQMAEAAGVYRQALLTMISDVERPAVAVLSPTPAKTEGLLLGLEGGIWAWVRQGKRALDILSLGGEQTEPGEIVSAIATGDDKVALLAVPSEGAVRVLELAPRKARMLFFLPPPPRPNQYPGNADALAIDPRGDLAVIRLASGAEPASKDDPALLMRAGAAPIELAPWSTLTPADAAECVNDSAGYRALLQTQRAWLDVRNAQAPIQEARGMLALVRWSAQRVCLEAVMVAADQVDVRGNPTPTSYVAKFSGKPVAARLGLVPGTEYRSSQTCRLQAAPR